MFVNISMSRQLVEFHNKALRLDPDDVRAPFPAAFWVHGSPGERTSMLDRFK